jgi:hypothetical protein
MSNGAALAGGFALTASRIARVKVPLPAGGTSVGTAFPIARLDPSPERPWNTLLLTARHVLSPEGTNAPMPPPRIVLDFPDTSVELLEEKEGVDPFTAVLVMDGAERPGGELDPTDDWVLLGANLPEVVAPFLWGILDESEVTLARGGGSTLGCSGAGYPTTGKLNNFKWVRGSVVDAGGRETRAYLAMSVNASDNLNTDPAGFSGGPMAIGEVIFALFSTSIALGSAIVGNAEVGGTRRARPLQPIMARVAEKFGQLATPRPILELPADDDLKQICTVAQTLAANALSAGTLAALDQACAAVLGTLLRDLPTEHVIDLLPGDGKDAPPHTFVRAVQRLVRLAKGEKSPLMRMLGRLAAQLPTVREAFGQLLTGVDAAAPPPEPPVAAAPAPVVLDVAWASAQDKQKVRITLRAPHGLGKGANCEADAAAEPMIRACEALLQPWLAQLGETRPVEVWAPFDFADVAFHSAKLQGGEEDESDPVGALAPVTLRVRWPTPLNVPPEVAQARAAALKTLTLPVATLPGPMSETPKDDPESLLLDSGAADPDVWRGYARNHPKLLVVAIAATSTPGSIAKLAKAVQRGGVPVVVWQRGNGDHLSPLLRSPVPRLTLRRRLLDYRNDHRTADFTVVLTPSIECLPTDDLLSNPMPE